jgi:hypothetical protein
MTARLTTLPDALRGGAWPSPDTPTAPVLYGIKSRGPGVGELVS